jgi:short subunit dehydrogenase-like uncharacterized protein
MNNNILIYGANGYTAELIIELARSEGVKPILAGRSEQKLVPLARLHGLTYRVFGLDDTTVIAKNLVGVAAVLNCAGPFSRTAKAMAEGCIAAGVMCVPGHWSTIAWDGYHNGRKRAPWRHDSTRWKAASSTVCIVLP